MSLLWFVFCIGVEVVNLSRVSCETNVEAVALSTELLFEILPITSWVIITLFISFDQSQLHVFHHISVTDNRFVAILP
jgi:hypothetical protein